MNIPKIFRRHLTYWSRQVEISLEVMAVVDVVTTVVVEEVKMDVEDIVRCFYSIKTKQGNSSDVREAIKQ